MKSLKPVYLIYSEQKFLLNQALKRLKGQILSQSLGDLNVCEFSSPTDFEQFEVAIGTVGFFDQRKVIILQQADKLSKQQVDTISNYLKSPNPAATLVLVASKKNEALFKRAREGKFFFEYKAPKKGQLGQWIIEQFKKEGKKVNYEAAFYLTGLLGNDLSLLANEIEKIALYASSKESVSIEDIAAVSSVFSHETIFDLVDALGQANLNLALWHLNHLLQTEKEGRIFHMIVRQFRLLLKTKGLVSEESSLALSAKKLMLPPFIVSKYMKQAKHFSISKLVEAHSILLQTEKSFKTTATPLNTSLELALVKILAA